MKPYKYLKKTWANSSITLEQEKPSYDSNPEAILKIDKFYYTNFLTFAWQEKNHEEKRQMTKQEKLFAIYS